MNERRKAAIHKAADLIVSGKAKYDLKSIPDEVLEAAIKKVKRQGDPLGKKLYAENLRRNANKK